MSIVLDVYTPSHSLGLKHDAEIIASTINSYFSGGLTIRKLFVPLEFYKSEKVPDSLITSLGYLGDIAIFVERIFSADFIQNYKSKSLYINPEWFTHRDKSACDAYDVTILHKSKHYYSSIMEKLPNYRHHYTGFTSIDPSISVMNYSVFSHFRGQSRLRLTQNLIDIWRANPDFPLLRLQAYGADMAISPHAWADAGNIQFYFGKVEKGQYFHELAKGGIHLCTAQVEGFGHFLNEARAMSALTIALDAPPMNELISQETGILVPAKASHRQGLGTVYHAENQDLVDAIQYARSMSVVERERLGRNARTLYEQQSEAFKESLYGYLQTVLEDISKQSVKSVAVETIPIIDENSNITNNGLTFDHIYENNLWGKSSEHPGQIYSGPGSHDSAVVMPYVSALSNFFGKLEKKLSVVDIGCGDFAVGSQIRHLFGVYIACDVSQFALDYCKEKYREYSVDFRYLDATSGELPVGEVIIFRQVLQHLDNASIKYVVEKIEGKYLYAIITEHLPLAQDFPQNLDKSTGPDIRLRLGSGIVLSESPFRMIFKKATELVSVPQFGGRIVTTLYEF